MKNILTIIIFSITVFLASCQYLEARNSISSKYIFSTLTIDDGLPLNFIDDIFKDSRGFLWFAIQGGGLCRYDGYDFITFNVNSFPISLKSNFIRKVQEDDFHRLWILSDAGIDVIDLYTMQRSKIVIDSKLLEKILNVSATSMLKDTHGNIWFISKDAVYKINFNSSGSINNIVSSRTELPTQSSFTTINRIDKEIWVGRNGSIFRVLEAQSEELVLSPISDLPVIGENLFIYCIVKQNNTIWVGTESGLIKYNTRDKSSYSYVSDINKSASISHNVVTDICETNDGALVVATLRGLNFYNPEINGFERVYHNNSPFSLNNDFVNCMLADGNNLWIGTEAGGINKMTLRKLDIRNYMHSNDNHSSLSPNPVNSIIEDRHGDLWVGTVEGGLNKKHKGQDDFVHYTMNNSALTHNSVSALEEDSSGRLWIGTWGGGINTMTLSSSLQAHIKTMPINHNYIAVLKNDSINNGMWIGTNRDIVFFDYETNSERRPLPESMTRDIMGVLGCFIDRNQQLWIGTSKGVILIDLLHFDRSGFKCPAQYFTIDDPAVNKLMLNSVTCIYQSKDNTIWIGSNGYGICKLLGENGVYTCQTYTTTEGLGNNAVYSILEDEEGMIWISTGRGISCYNPSTDRFVNYTKNDGLINDQFYWNAGYKSPTSKILYFGKIEGLIELNVNKESQEVEHRRVVFSKLQILNETVWFNKGKYISSDISYASKIILHEQDKSFSVEFSALDYENPSTVAYSYRLLGFDDKWIDVPASRRFASYTNLQPGSYTLQVRCMSKAYDWSGDIAELEIVVHPFFYKTGWFISLLTLLLILLAMQLYRWRVNSLKKQREILSRKVEERTLELKEQNDILVTQNEKISFQRRQLIDMSRKVQDAMADRMSFFTNITHEFRTPITLIIGPIERALKLSENPKVIEQLQYVARNSKHLLSLVNQLMDFRKVESEGLVISPVGGNLLSFLDEILIPFESFADERNISIKKVFRMANPRVMFDEEAMRKIVSNLLSNAIKFTPDGGTVTIYVCALKGGETNKNKLYICVQDSGLGIKEEDINRIFNRFYQSEEHLKYPVYGQSGTGIGLYLCKNIVNLMEGIIYARNNHVRGASFRIILPLVFESINEEVITDEEVIIPFQEITEGTPSISDELQIHSETILIVEDNMDMRKYISSILSGCYSVVEAENGEKALAILQSARIDFIISDLMMPVMDGLELSKRVKADFTLSHIPFLMLTAKTSLETRISSYRMGSDEFLTKPFDEELLLTRIDNILKTRKVYQQKFGLYMNIDELNIVEDSADEKFLKKAIEILKENYTNTEYEVSDFINAMGVSKSLLNNKMQMLAGKSAGHFIRDYRLNIARELILRNKGNKNISEIAYEVGFNDPKYFTRCFTKHFGIAPSAMAKGDE
ncbi:response regulator [Dysgonomonas sp. Marseille-P4677]|uniref:hybrid sensor histidine kinase/response regulator transcription factor n=1 Tax=Dysgonomonas sp. Marseille-P4677 TaxID=2364790 RepID=UPI001911BEE1|nr:two-component regulator propeller domain-containing protein [Dysgonomonas sp. Marseille-P4677]MBK5720952.1 response regulator [Dysgonomonas sp. Marseille-P4677]